MTDRLVARYLSKGLYPRTKTAAFPPIPPRGDEGGGAATRNIPANHEFNSKALKPLSKALWASSIALGHTLTAYRHLSRLKSTTVSPDGALGGRGYVMNLADMRKSLFDASEKLSAISDTLYDEATAPHWKAKLAQLDENDREDVSRFVEEAEEVMENPEGEAEEEIEKIEKENDKDKDKEDPAVENGNSTLPTSGSPEAQATETRRESPEIKTASVDLVQGFNLYQDPEKVSSLYVDADVPQGDGVPRVTDRGPGMGNGELGDFTVEDSAPIDDWSTHPGGRDDYGGENYDYTSEWENELARSASSGVPDHSSDPTPTDADDFGLGYGASGEASKGYANPSGEGAGYKGVEGPASGLPGSPSQSSGDTSGPTKSLAENPRQARSLLPQDAARPVSRMDYYDGPKDNMVSVGTSEVPGEERTPGRDGQDLMNTYHTEEDTATDYTRYDYSTPTYREPEGNHPGQDHQEPWAPDGEVY